MKLPIVKTTKYDRDVLTEQDPRNFALNSDLKNVSIRKIMEVEIAAPFPNAFPHGLDHAPFFLVLMEAIDLDDASMGFSIFDPKEGLPYGWDGRWYCDNDAIYCTVQADQFGSTAYILIFDTELS